MMKSTFKIAFLLFLIPLVSFANNDKKLKQEKSKTIKKQYSVDRNATVNIDNKYGNINITTWNKNSVEITVVITVKGNSLSSVEKKLSRINVDFNASSNLVSAKTKFDNSSSSWSFWGKSNNTSYKVNYTVKMPVSNNVKLNNDYGNILINEINGTTNINCDYGKLIIGDLNNSNNNINIDYTSSSTINFMKSGSINADYSKLTVDKTDKVKITIGTKANNNFNFKMNLQYSKFRYNNDRVEMFKSIEKSSKKYYEGVYGKGKSNSTLIIKSQYGGVNLKEL